MSSESSEQFGNSPLDQLRGGGTERLEISSGYVVMIDQFMLGNDQLFTSLQSCGDVSDLRDAEIRLKEIVGAFGGCLLAMPSGQYLVYRDAELSVMALAPGAESVSVINEVLREQSSAVLCGRVFVDTRCVVFADASILANRDLLKRYQELRRNGEEKRGRDMLREQGAAVRYGFQKHGDELGVFNIPALQAFALWPDVIG